MTSLRPVRVVVLSLAVAIISAVAAEATTPLPFTAPAPDIAPLAPFAGLPLEKPPITPMDVTAPGMSVAFPAVPTVPVAVPVAPPPAPPVGAERPGHEADVWSAHAAGWTALRRDDAVRARDLFKRVLAGPVPAVIDAWARHGLGLSLYATGSFADAARTWSDLEKRSIPADLTRDVALYHGDALGRLGEHARAEQQLKAFVDGARAKTVREHPLLGIGLVRLGWWAFAAGHPAESAAVFKSCFSSPSVSASNTEQDWAAAGMALALGASGDWNYGRGAVHWLYQRKSVLAAPIALELMRVAIEKKHVGETLSMAQDVLAGPIAKPLRAWILVMKGDVLRQAGDRDEARTQYDLAQQTDPGSDVAAYAAYRLAQADFEMGEFAQAAAGLDALVQAKMAADGRTAALLLHGEAAYRAGNYAAASQAFRRVLADAPKHPQTPFVQLSLAWAALGQGQKDDARRQFLAFAATRPDHASTADALAVAAQITLDSGDVRSARPQLEHIIGKYPDRPGSAIARLNRAILMVRAGQHRDAQPLLREWIRGGPVKPALGHAHAALGAALLASKQPAAAAREFVAAQRAGAGAYAHLGAGIAAMADRRADDASRALAAARKDGTGEMLAAAEYALAAVAVERGRIRSFKPTALEALRQAPSSASAPQLLYLLTGIAIEEGNLGAALETARKLTHQFPNDDAADDALERVGAAAAKVPDWPIVFDAYRLMRQRYPSSPFVTPSTRVLAEAAFQTGRTSEARLALEHVVATAPTDGPAWLMLAQTRKTGGDRTGALEAYGQAAKVVRLTEWTPALTLEHARLLAHAKQWTDARALFQRLLKSGDPAIVLEASYSIGDTYRGEENLTAAAQFYMTAAYLAPESAFGRRSLLAAGQVFNSLKQPDAAAKVYRQLLAQTNVPGDLAAAAQQGLAAVKSTDKPQP